MSALAGPYHLAALVLLVSAAAKFRDRSSAARALVSAGLRVPLTVRRRLVVVVAVSEIVVGAAVLLVDSAIPAVAMASLYVVFTGFLVILRRSDPAASCGCFGGGDAPPGPAHVVVNLAAVGVAVTAAVTGPPAFTDLGSAGPAVAYLALLAAGTGAVVALTSANDDLRKEVLR